jgi:uncharacterized protein (DUF362 family)
MRKIIDGTDVVFLKKPDVEYPISPFHPDKNYPEYPFGSISSAPNKVYEMVRDSLRLMRFDIKHFDTPIWNPFGEFINPGDVVLIKPNLVRNYHPYNYDIKSIHTNGSIIRAVIDYVIIALKNSGKIILGDAPLQSCDYEEIKIMSGIYDILKFYRDNNVSNFANIVDFRLVRAITDRSSIYGDILKQEKNSGDCMGYTAVNLGSESMLEPVSDKYKRFRVTCYNPSEMVKHHQPRKHEYIIPNTVLMADVIINLPKIKTHHKAGITGALKNLIGINGHKDWLPHHRKGSFFSGGDEYLNQSMLKAMHSLITDLKEKTQIVIFKKLLSILQRIFYFTAKKLSSDAFFEGSWWGNDTIWRTIIDLNRILIYSEKNGVMTSTEQRKLFTLADGIIAGEKDGPLAPTPRRSGMIVCGTNPATVDIIIAAALGFNWEKIPQIKNSFAVSSKPLVNFSPDEIRVFLENGKSISFNDFLAVKHENFTPHHGWKGYIET